MLIAFINEDEINESSLSWLTSKKDPYAFLDAVDMNEDLLESVYRMYKNLYGKISRNLLINDMFGLFKYDRWVIIQGSSGDIIGFALYRSHAHGIKLGLTGSLNSKKGKRILIQFTVTALNVNGVFAEVSPPLENVLADKVPKVGVDKAAKIMKSENKVIDKKNDGFHYSRAINNIGTVQKLMVGKPNL